MNFSISKLSKNFGGVKALDNCSIEIEKGKITAIIGPNGSGKTTLFNVISRLIDEDAGKISLNENDLTKMQDYEVAKKYISRTFQEVRLFSNLTIKDHIEIALSRKDEKLFESIISAKKRNEKKIKEILAHVGLDKPLNTKGADLSYGQRKLLDLAMALAKPHHILLLDEPVAGVNPALRKEIKKIIQNLAIKGETIILIEHDMNFVMDVADTVYVLETGRVIAKGKPEQIQNNKKVLEAYLGD